VIGHAFSWSGTHELAVRADRLLFFDPESERRTDPVPVGAHDG
jgi:hypothetical protein